MRLDGEEHAAPAGTFASIEPPATRTILNRSEPRVTALLIGVHPAGGYAPRAGPSVAQARELNLALFAGKRGFAPTGTPAAL